MRGHVLGARPAVHVLLEHLEREGVEYVFGIPGGPIMPLYEALADRGRIKPVLTKHEEGAAFMADAYARVSGRIGVCCTTTGPGATNALTGVAVAHADHVPLLLLTAQVSTRRFGMGAFQESGPDSIDLVSLFRPVTKWSTMVPHPGRLGATIRNALRLMRTGAPGPVHVSLPLDYMTAPVSDEAPRGPAWYPAETMDRRAIREVAGRLLAARRPAILAGQGVNLARAWPALRALAERLEIPVATTFKAKGALPEDHPLSLGVFGKSGEPRASEVLLSEETDLLLVAGSALGEDSSGGFDPRLARKVHFLQLDVDPGVIGRNYPVDVPLVGDAAAALGELREECERRLASGRAGVPFRPPLPERAPLDAPADDPARGLKPQTILRELREAMPRDAVLFVDNGSLRAWTGRHFAALEPGTFFVNMGLASMGYAVAGSVGGKLAAPDRPVVALVGDAAFAMNGMEVHAAVERGVHVIWVVANNGGHAMIHHGERAQFGRPISSPVFRERLDVAGVARGLGAAAVRVARTGELADALRRALRAEIPVVIDAQTDMTVAPPMAGRVDALLRELTAA